MSKFTMVLTSRDKHNMRRITELTGVSKSEAIRRALEHYRCFVEELIAKEATRAAALQGAGT